MKLIYVKEKGKGNSYSNTPVLLFYTKEDVEQYMEEFSKLVADEFRSTLKRYERGECSGNYVNCAAHTGYTRVPLIAFSKACSKTEEPNILDIGIAVDEILLEKKEDMLRAVEEGDIFCNLNGGYGNLKEAMKGQANLEVTESETINKGDLHNLIWKLDQKCTPSYYNKINVCYYKGKCYFDSFYHYTHTYICHKHNLPEDKVLKLIYDKDYEGSEFGISHLKLSEVYLACDVPIVPSKTDLDIIESIVKEF